MPTAAQNAVASAVLQSIVVALPLWIAVLRYVSSLSPEINQVDNSEKSQEYFEDIARYKSMMYAYVFMAIMAVVLAGTCLINYLVTANVVSVIHDKPFIALGLTPKEWLGFSAQIMGLFMPMLFALFLVGAVLLDFRSNYFEGV